MVGTTEITVDPATGIWFLCMVVGFVALAIGIAIIMRRK